MALDVDQQVTARGTVRAGPVLGHKQAITEMSKGRIVEVLSSDPSTNQDISVWAKKLGDERPRTRISALGIDFAGSAHTHHTPAALVVSVPC